MHIRRFLALLLCLLLALGPTCATFAEDAEMELAAAPELTPAPVHEPDPTPEPVAEKPTPEAVQEKPEPAEDASAEEPAEDIEETPAPDASSIPTEKPDIEEDDAPSAEETAPQTTKVPAPTPSIDFTRSAAYSPEFVLGYAELVGEGLAFAGPAPNADTVLSLRKGVVYVLSRSATPQADRLESVFDDGSGERVVWIDADRLRPLSPEETRAFVQARAAAKDARYLFNAAELPLDALSYVSAVTYDLAVASEPTVSVPAMLVPQVEFTLGVGEKAAIPVSFTDGGSHSITYKSADTRIATVSAAGKITAKKAGETDIVLNCELGNSAKVHVIVKKAPGKVSLSAPRKTLGVNEQIQLTAKLSSGSASKLSYSTSKASVAAVDANGKVTTFKAGTATITVTTFNGRKASVKLTVKAAPKSVSLSDKRLEMGVKQTATLKAALSAGSAGACTFTSSDESVVLVDAATGALEALAIGSADVTVTTYNGKTATCPVTVKAAPSEVTLAESEITIGVGESADMPAITFGENSAGSCTFNTSGKKIATVSDAGVIKGVKKGSATITVTTHNGKTATLKVNVKNAPAKVTLTAPSKSMGKGDTMQLTANFSAGAASRKLTFSSSMPSVATVDQNGKVTAVASGAATITVKTFNKKKASVKITVKSAPTSVSLDKKTLSMGVRQTATLTPTLSSGSAGSCTFTSSDTSVLKVNSATGALEALAAGTATITVETYNGKTAACTVTVKDAPSRVSFAQSELVIGVGEKLDIPGVTLGEPGEDCAGSYTFQSSNKKIAKISGSAVQGVKKGSAKITVTTHNGKTATLKVSVKNAPAKVTLSAPHKTLGVDEKLQLTAKFSSGAASALSYTSSDSKVATVSASGVVTAIAPGTAKITAKTFNNKKGSITLTVAAKPASVALPRTLALGVGETYTIKPTLSPSGSGGGLTFSVDDKSVATVNAATGAIKAVGPGTTTLQVKTYNDLKATCQLTVKNAPTGISLQEGNFTLAKGDTYQLLPPVLKGADAASAGLTYKSSAKTYAKVSSSGVITAVKAGKAKITVTTFNGKKASVTVTVKAAPKSISFAESTRQLFIGLEFTPEVKFDSNITASYTLTSSNPKVASVSGKTVCAVASGTATLTATSFNGKKATMKVTVPAPPDSVSLKPASLTLGVGESTTLSAVMPSGQGAALSYESDDTSIAAAQAVDNESVSVTGAAVGSTTIRVRSQNGKEGTAKVTVKKAPTVLSISPNRAGRSIDEKQLQLSVAFGGADEGSRVTYTSSDTSIAKVSSSGLVTFVKVGSVKITAQTYNGHSAVCELTIAERPGKMSFDKSEYSVALGDTIQLPASFDKGCESYTLTSADASIAEVFGDTVRGIKLGTTTLSAVSRSGLKASCKINVVDAPTGVKLNLTKADLVFGAGATLQLQATTQPSGVGSVYYFSSDPSVASVDYTTGVVTARGKGDCVIRATTYDGQHTAECAIHVTYLLEGVRVGIDPGHQGQGDLSKESSSPKGGTSKYKVSYGGSGKTTHIAEHKTNLAVGLKLRDALERLGAEVYMTRDTADVNISNKQRALMMNKLGVDLVLRLHCNSADSTGVKGVSIFIRKTCAYANSVVNGKTLLANENAAAKAIYSHFVKATGCAKRGLYKNNDYTMNNWSTVPCLLIEMGFMTNPSEDKKLNNPAYQDKMVQGMVNGICEYMGRDLPTEW